MKNANEYKQIIIVRKDLGMSMGKMSAQVSHASMAFLLNMVRDNTCKRYDNKLPVWDDKQENRQIYYLDKRLYELCCKAKELGQDYFYYRRKNPNAEYSELEFCEPVYHYETHFQLDNNIYEKWLNGAYTKCVLQANNKNNLIKAKLLAEQLGMKEGEDFFLIYDNCYTEISSEEADGTTLTCIGFKPMCNEVIDKVGKKFHLYI